MKECRACLTSAARSLSGMTGIVPTPGDDEVHPPAREALRVVRQATRDELLPWVYGQADPVVDPLRERRTMSGGSA